MSVTTVPPSSSHDHDHDGLPPRQRLLAIATVVLGLSMAVLDGSIANLALPAMAADLKASNADAIWVINSYQIAMAVCLLPLASLGEVIGYRRVYLGGLFLFTLASLACAASGDMLQLSLARVLQGLGAAGILSVNTALIRFIYPARQLGRAIGYNALVAGTGNALGPSVAGLILHLASWHWLFLINIPLGLAALAVGSRALPASPLSPRRFDTQSAVLCMGFIGLLLYTIDAVGHLQGGWVVAGCALLTAISLVLLLKLQSASAPMLPLDLLRIPLFALSIGTSFCSFAAQMAVFVMLPFMLQDYLGMSAARAGMLLTAWPVAVALTGVVAGKLSDRIPAGLLGGIGLAVMCVGLLALLTVDRSTPDGVTLAMFAVCGLGFGLFQSPNNRTMISAAPRERTGGASGMLGTARLTGQTVGASVVAMLMGVSAAPYAPVLCFAAALAGAACLVSLSRLRY
ncbi:MFS transporter [Herbaspirillum aquaticum]|uniref:MFS transporter n=1 Tax=Herbaspirillum aquaticum TaxID=568783 RepID=A0A225SXN9_9BURK|nr:MFS transporter [Herbaspirillum aquaticum]OWY35769.1 MFS transporter [Herbaspirillum aquaticum]